MSDIKGEYARTARHGRWLYDEGDVVCSECDGIVPGEIEYIRYKFCPWCGAKMDEKED